MNLGQTMLSAMTLVVLAALVLNANRLIIEGEKDMAKGEAYDIAVNYAQALMTEISRKKFDAATKDSVYQDPSEFTSPYSLGASWSEYYQINPNPDVAPFKSISVFSDVDDYHGKWYGSTYSGYQRVINTDMIQDLILRVEVYYVTDTNPNNKVYYRTYFKRVTVTASHSAYLNDVTFSTLVTN